MFIFGFIAYLETHPSFRLRLNPLQRFDYAKYCYTPYYQYSLQGKQILYIGHPSCLFHYLLGLNFVDAVES